MSPVRWWRWLLVAASLTVLGAGLAATPDRLEARITSRRPPAGPAPRAAPFRPTERPSLDGSPVTCVIVTSEALAGEFERLAAWRLRTGTRAVVRTVAWIDARYAGADGAARVRAFLTDAYVLWGTRQVVLAGDVDQVPVRYLVSRYFVEDPAVDHWEIPSDLYYAGLDGDWNADGDALAGEVGDGADFEPELQVGRIPVATPAEARGFVERQLAYERGDAFDDTYPATAVFLAEVLFESGGTVELDGAEYAEHMIEGLPPTLPVRRLYESTSTWPHDAPLGRETALAELDAGPGLVVHVGHGFRATLSVGAGAIGNLDIDGLGNGRRRPIMLALNCSSAAFDYHSIAERLLLGEGGGVIAYVGMSRFAFPPTADLYQRVLVWAAYARGAPTLGAALDSTWALLGSVGAATDSTAHRYTKFALAVLGDPATPIHARPPGRLMVEHPAHVAADASSIRATVRDSGGMPVAGARVTLDAPAELHVSGLTAADGTVELPCAVPAAGVVSVTATAPGYRPALSSLCAGTAAGAVLDLARLEVAGGTLAAGQCAELALEIENTGAATAGDARVELSLLSGAGRLVAASHALGDVAPGARVTVQGDSLC
ncbi:MAG: C25 family cysteine peptidase, partial [Candidatus Eiseniibacteriota bacterium]